MPIWAADSPTPGQSMKKHAVIIKEIKAKKLAPFLDIKPVTHHNLYAGRNGR